MKKRKAKVAPPQEDSDRGIYDASIRNRHRREIEEFGIVPLPQRAIGNPRDQQALIERVATVRCECGDSCLKLYCPCFQGGIYCKSFACGCVSANCRNTTLYEEYSVAIPPGLNRNHDESKQPEIWYRNHAIISELRRNPLAFRPKTPSQQEIDDAIELSRKAGTNDLNDEIDYDQKESASDKVAANRASAAAEQKAEDNEVIKVDDNAVSTANQSAVEDTGKSPEVRLGLVPPYAKAIPLSYLPAIRYDKGPVPTSLLAFDREMPPDKPKRKKQAKTSATIQEKKERQIKSQKTVKDDVQRILKRMNEAKQTVLDYYTLQDVNGEDHQIKIIEEEDETLKMSTDDFDQLVCREELEEYIWGNIEQDHLYVDESNQTTVTSLLCHETLDEIDVNSDTPEVAKNKALRLAQEVALMRELTSCIRQKTLKLARKRLRIASPDQDS